MAIFSLNIYTAEKDKSILDLFFSIYISFVEQSELTSSDRGSGGFGSTGN